jgi:ubiquinone/menaquinone biosynthesis C-methylase UbiE
LTAFGEAIPTSETPMDELINAIKDPTFRSRFVQEYETIRRWSAKATSPGSRVMDFGCGQGIAALGFAVRDPTAVVCGVDVADFHKALPGLSRANLGRELPDNLEFRVAGGGDLPFAANSFDLVYSWSVFEHIRRDLLQPILRDLSRVLKDDGHLFIQIDPLYFSPRGAHVYNAVDTPWVHLLDQHDVLLANIMASAVPDRTKSNLIEQYETLNRITADELVEQVEQGGFEIVRKETGKCALEPPERLRRIYTEEVLTTATILLLARKAAR